MAMVSGRVIYFRDSTLSLLVTLRAALHHVNRSAP